MKKICQIVLEKETFEILIFLLYIHVDNIVIYNLRVVGSNPCGSKKNVFILIFYYITMSFLLMKYLNPLKIGKCLIITLGKGEFLNRACFPHIE